MRKLTLVLLLVGAASLTGLSPTAGANEAFEPNDGFADASRVSPGTYTGLTLVGNEDDFYEVSLSPGETIAVTVTVPTDADGTLPDNRPYLELYAADGTLLDRGTVRNTPDDATVRYVLQHQSERARTVYVDVRGGLRARGTTTPYAISLDWGANDRFEANGVPESATPLDPGTYDGLTLLDDEDDYYAVAVDRGETVDVTARFPTAADGTLAENAPSLELRDADGDLLDRGEFLPTPDGGAVRLHLEHQSATDQTLFVRVRGCIDVNVATTYTLSLDRGGNDRFEANGVRDHATPLDAGTYQDLRLSDVEDDFYAIALDAGETLSVTTTFPTGPDGTVADNRPGVALVDPNGTHLDGGALPDDREADAVGYRLSYRAEGERTVYLNVYGTVPLNVNTSYALTVSASGDDVGPEPTGPAAIGSDRPTDPDGDGVYEDVDGDGSLTILDVQAFFANLDGESVRADPAAFDFNGDGRTDVVDVQRLFAWT